MDEIPVNLPVGAGTPDRLAGDPRDWEACWNARQFIEKLLTANPNVKVVGAGVGAECADLDITIDGYPFNILIKPRS